MARTGMRALTPRYPPTLTNLLMAGYGPSAEPESRVSMMDDYSNLLLAELMEREDEDASRRYDPAYRQQRVPDLGPLPPASGQQQQGQQFGLQDGKRLYDLYSTFGQGGGPGMMSGSLMAVPGGAGFGTAAGGAAFDAGVAAVPGGLSNAAVGSAASPGFFGSLFGGGEAAAGAAGAAGAGTMGTAAMAAGPLALFLLPFMFAMNKAYGDD